MPQGVYPRKDVVTRFMGKVGPPDEKGCRLWLAGLDEKGYGRFWAYGRTWPAHTFARMLKYGAPAAGLLGLHSCDNPPCVEAEHIRYGTYKDNSDDAQERGRHTCLNPAIWLKHAKLTPEEVIAIFTSPKSTGELALQFSISIANICDIRKGRTWTHITGGLESPAYVNRCRVLTDEQVLLIRSLPDSNADVARRFGVSGSVVSQIRNRKAYKWLEAEVVSVAY